MKKLMFAAFAVCAVFASTHGADSSVTNAPAKPVADKAAITWAKRFNMAPEAWLAMPASERNAKAQAYYAEQKTKNQAIWTKRLKVTDEEWNKLSRAEQQAKIQAYYSDHKAKTATKATSAVK